MAAIGAVGMLFMLLLGILWILVPFAIFGVKPLLRDLVSEQRKNYAALSTLSQQIHAATLLMPGAEHAPQETAAESESKPRGRVEPTLGQITQNDQGNRP